MATVAQWRKLALSMPEAEEKAHNQHPDFRVRNKIFAGVTPDGKRGSLKLTPDVQSLVLSDGSGAFEAAAGAWGRQGWTYVELARVPIGALEDLVFESWSLVAPKALAQGHTGSKARAAKPQKSPRKKPLKPAKTARAK